MKKTRHKKHHSQEIYSEDDWFEEVCRLKDKAEAEGNMAAVARFVEIIARRKGFIKEAPERQVELDAARQKEVDFLLRLYAHPEVRKQTELLLAEAERVPNVYGDTTMPPSGSVATGSPVSQELSANSEAKPV